MRLRDIDLGEGVLKILPRMTEITERRLNMDLLILPTLFARGFYFSSEEAKVAS